MYRIVTVDKKYMVIVSEFYHDLGHVADVAARNAEHKSGRMGLLLRGLKNMPNYQCIQAYGAISL